MYLRDCESTVIKNTKVTGGQNALMMTNCNKGKIYNNDFSFNSGLGIAMYRSSFNTIAYNKINFNVRGYSDGVYNRGRIVLAFWYMNKVIITFFIRIL
jgi:parallel beta-helix repeat protein